MLDKVLHKIQGSEVKIFVFLSIIIFYVVSFCTGSIQDIIVGMKQIFISRDALITDYFVLANFSAAFFNAAFVLLIEFCILLYEKVMFTGLTLAALYINVGFALFGKNPLNILPIIIGTTLYAWLHHTKLSRFIYTALFGTCLAPLVTEMVFILPFSLTFNVVCAILMGLFIGFVLPPLSIHTASMHMGYNLFNVGFSAGILAFIIICVFRSFGFEIDPCMLWYEGRPLPLIIGLASYFVFTILYGLLLTKGKIEGMKKIMKHPGRAVADFVMMDGAGLTFINMGVIGLICLLYILLIGGDLSGPLIGSMFTAFGFAAFGAHPKNYIPVLLGVFLSTFINIFSPTSPGVQLAAMFAVGIAPIAGQFGVIAGIVAGMLHVAIVTWTNNMYGGLNLYNNGFSCGWVAIFMIPLIESLMRQFEDKKKRRRKVQ